MKNTIQSLIIGGNRIRDNGMKSIAEGFQHNHSLTILKIHRCLLTEEGMHDNIYVYVYIYIYIYIYNKLLYTVNNKSLVGLKFGKSAKKSIWWKNVW